MVILIDTTRLNKDMTVKWKECKHAKPEDKSDAVYYEAHSKMAIIEGSKGFIVTDGECIHTLLKTADETVSVDFYRHEKKENGSSFGIIPQFGVSLSITELKEYASDKKMEWQKFVHLFGGHKARMQSNYALLLGSVKEIGASDKLPKWNEEED